MGMAKHRSSRFQRAEERDLAATAAFWSKKCQSAPPRLSCHKCGNLSGGTAWWWDTRLWEDSADGPICPVCIRAEEDEEMTPRREPLTAPNALYDIGEEPWEE